MMLKLLNLKKALDYSILPDAVETNLIMLKMQMAIPARNVTDFRNALPLDDEILFNVCHIFIGREIGIGSTGFFSNSESN